MKLFSLRKNKGLIQRFKLGEYNIKELKEMLSTIDIKELRAIGKEIIYADYDGYNNLSKNSSMIYFDNLDRWQKEFFVKQRLYKIL